MPPLPSRPGLSEKKKEGWAPRPSADRVLALRAEPPAASHRFALRPTGAGAFTEGPWVVHPVMAWVSPAADLEMPICQMRMATDGVTCEPQAKADARLIASAPDLFEALERMIAAELAGDGAAMARARHHARNVMAKARGQ